MLSILGQSFIGGLMILYLLFIGYSGLAVLKTKVTKDTSSVGIFLYYHGVAWIGMFCGASMLGLTYIFTKMLNAYINGV